MKQIKNVVSGQAVASLILYGYTHYNEAYFDNVKVTTDIETLDKCLYNVLTTITNGYLVSELSHMSVKGAVQRLRDFLDIDELKEHLKTLVPKQRISLDYFEDIEEITKEQFQVSDMFDIVCDNIDMVGVKRKLGKLCKGKDTAFTPYCSNYLQPEESYTCLGCPIDIINGRCSTKSEVFYYATHFTYNERLSRYGYERENNIECRKQVKQFATKWKHTFKNLQPSDIRDELVVDEDSKLFLLNNIKNINIRRFDKYNVLLHQSIRDYDKSMLH